MKNFQLGYFLKPHHVEKAIELIKFQLQQNSPLYNNLDFSLYKQIDLKTIDSKIFYSEYIERDAFYYFKNLFYTKKYFSVQRAYKIREFHYLTLHSLILYYSLGMYIRELLEKSIQIESDIYSKRNINIFYGGKINYNNPEKSNIFYYSDYKDFIRLKEKLTLPKEGYITYAISLDIKSFFYSINHQILLNALEKKCSSILRRSLNYDECTKESIILLLQYLQQHQLGLPVSNQNLISSFLSSVYFSEFDEYVVSKYLTDDENHYIRYVDDFYLIFKVKNTDSVKHTREKIYNIENDFAQFLINKLELSVSTAKSDRFEIKDKESHLRFLNYSGMDSPFDGEFDFEDFLEDSILKIEIKEKTTPQVFDDCLQILKNLKKQTEELSQLKIDQKESTYLNYILILKSCLDYSKSPNGIEKIKQSKIFENNDEIDFYLTKPKVLFHLISLTKESRNAFFNIIVQKLHSEESLMAKLTIIDKFLHQINFLISESSNEIKSELEQELATYKEIFLNLIGSIREENTYLVLIKKLLDPNLSIIVFNQIFDERFLNSDEAISLTQQIKLKRIAETLKNYNVSFNHLLNEFQSMFEIAHFESKHKKANEILQKMNAQGHTISEIMLITDFFERRNTNSISHSNTIDIGYWGVNAEEYFKFKEDTKSILKSTFDYYKSK